MIIEYILSMLPDIYYYHYYIRLIGLEGRVFAKGTGDLGSIPGQVISKIQKWYMVRSLYGILDLSDVRSKADLAAESALSFPLTPMWLGVHSE